MNNNQNWIVLLVLFFHAFSLNGQVKLLNQYSERKDRYCSTDLFIYSDSTFYRESGCEIRSYLTLGTYSQLNDSILILRHKKMSDFNYLLKTEFVFDSTNTDRFKCFYKTLDDSLVEAYLYNYTLKEAEMWQKSDTIKLVQDFDKTFKERDSVLARLPLNLLSSYSCNKKDVDETVALCLEEFQYLNNHRQIIVIEPNVSKVVISVNLPFALLSRAINYKMKHSKYGEVEKEPIVELFNINAY